MSRIDINVDIGEGFPFDEELLDFATSANVCCGEHAGSWELTKETIFLCERKGVRLGMHPGFPDRTSMGRAPMQLDEVDQYANSIFEQVMSFQEYVQKTYGSSAGYLKPHGAWYNLVVQVSPADSSLFLAGKLMLDGALAFAAVPAMLLAGSSIISRLAVEQVPCISEGFADRGYARDGTLLDRSEPGAVLNHPEQIREQVLRLARTVDSICIHGDTPDCLSIAELVYRSLENAGYEVGF
jgi:UPF0271 protein